MDKVILITGASSGIGEGIARELAGRGAKVLLGARRTDRLDALAKGITTAGGTALNRQARRDRLRGHEGLRAGRP